jgi:UDPglucose 6-dehydrogenase
VANVGWVGLGKLGAPCAAALAYHGSHDVWGYDVRGTNPDDYDWSAQRPVNLCESITQVVTQTDGVVYVAVQTPHSPEYGGETVAPDEPREFEYAYLVNAVRAVCCEARAQRKNVTLVVVSTVLPGTFDRCLRPLLNAYVYPVYHPFFIAMGTVVEDFVYPEMTLFGADRPGYVDVVQELYRPFHNAPAPTMSIASAELTKVAYNTFISMKIVYANAMAEMCEATGADVDDLTEALACAQDRIISPRYLRAGMGDGGACHPRDNVALSALAQQHGLSVDLMGFLTRAREAQTERLADLVTHWYRLTKLPVFVLGRAYKPDVSSEDGSPALLLADYLRDREVRFTHIGNEKHPRELTDRPVVCVVATKHDEFERLDLAEGSVVIDPFGYTHVDLGVTLVTPGRRRA